MSYCRGLLPFGRVRSMTSIQASGALEIGRFQQSCNKYGLRSSTADLSANTNASVGLHIPPSMKHARAPGVGHIRGVLELELQAQQS